MRKMEKVCINKSVMNSIAEPLAKSFKPKDAVDFVIALEEAFRSMDFTEPLYKYFKKVMEREDPAGL